MSDLKPREIVRALDEYIIGQKKAKRSVAIALRNRWRRRRLPVELAEEIAPKNIVLIGPTGVGKTEIARRLSRLTDSPFNKVEASKFTEVGYMGRDVESMIRDLLELTMNDLKAREHESVRGRAEITAEERMLDLLLPKPKPTRESGDIDSDVPAPAAGKSETGAHTRERLREMLRAGKLDGRYIDMEVSEKSMPVVEIFSNVGMEEMGVNFKDMFENILPKNTKRRKMKVSDAMQILIQEEIKNLVDLDQITTAAVEKVEQSGIIFLDEIDKIVGKEGGHGPDVSREGVQRDLLPIVEGSTVTTKYGPVKTDHILFIAAGAFHTVKPSDLIPELQGRFPIRVELNSLNAEEFVRILQEPKNALLLQYRELMRTEGIELEFTGDAVAAIAGTAETVNRKTEDIGARRLHTIMERLLEEILFEGPEMSEKRIVINAEYVERRLSDIRDDEDLSRYIL